MANKCKLTPELQEKFIAAIRVGAHYIDACNYVGITDSTFGTWRALAEKGKEPYLAFSVALKEAEGMATVGWMAKIEKAANDGTWQAAAWKLERRYPERYGRTVQTQEVTGKDGGPVEITAVSQARDEIARRLVVLAERERPRLLAGEPDG